MTVEIRLLYIEDCPNRRLAEARLREVLAGVGNDAPVTCQLVATLEEAERLDFRGSPTILVDGKDPFADPEVPIALSCRLYRTPTGTDGAPTVEQLRSVLAGGC